MKFIVSKDDNSDILGDFLYVDYVLSVQTLYLYIKMFFGRSICISHNFIKLLEIPFFCYN